MSVPLANKPTVASGNKASVTNIISNTINSNNNDIQQIDGLAPERRKSNIQPPGLYNTTTKTTTRTTVASKPVSNDNAFKTPAPPSAGSRLAANLSNGVSQTVGRSSIPSSRQTSSTVATATKSNSMAPTGATKNSNKPTTTKSTLASAAKTRAATISSSANSRPISRLPPNTNLKVAQSNKSSLTAPNTISRSISINRSRPSSNLHQNINGRTNGPAGIGSRSPSIVSSIDSSVAGSKRPSVASSCITTASIRRDPNAKIPDTNLVRKGLAKFSNPIECQRQINLLNQKIQLLTDDTQSKEDQINRLQDQLELTLKSGVGYAVIVQYFAKRLKLDSATNLERECENLKLRVDQLEASEREHDSKLESILSDYKEHLQVELNLKEAIKLELDDTRKEHSQKLEIIAELHKDELNDLETKHSNIQEELQARIDILESELKKTTKELVDLKKEHENLTNSFNQLEESLTKDKDARVRYAQEKVDKLQKDVDSLNLVLEMRLERIHSLEKDSLLLGEIRNELQHSQDANKALKQETESLAAALEKKRTQFETLVAEHERVSQELKRERKERRRMTMKTEELEYVLNESCATESSRNDTSVSDLDYNGTDQLVKFD